MVEPGSTKEGAMKRIILFVFVFVFCSTAQAGMFDQIKGVTDTLEKATQSVTQPAKKAPASTTSDKAVPGVGMPFAQPLDSNSRIRLDRGKQAIAGIKIREDLRRNVPRSRAAEVIAEQRSVQMAADNAENELRMVRNKQHPEVAALQGDISTARDYLKDLNGVIKEHKTADLADQKVRQDFVKAYWKHRGIYEFWIQYYDEPNRFFSYADDTLAKARDAFKEISEGCTTRFQGVTDDPGGDRLNRYSVWCKMAVDGDAWLKRAVTNKATFYINQVTESFEKQSKLLAESKGSLGTWDLQYYLNPEARKAEILQMLEKDLKFVGLEKPPKEVFARADAALAKLIGEIREQVKNWPCYPDGTPMNDAYVQKTVLAAHKGSKFLKHYRQARDWEVRLNALGVPTHRRMWGKAVFKLPSETWCRAWYYTYFQDYQGRGYGHSYFNHGPQVGLTSICNCP
jgi:hypothetical protein